MKKELEFFKKGYYVDYNGNIYNKNGRQLNGCIDKNKGYFYGFMIYNKKKYHVYFHRFVAFMKFGNMLYCDRFEVRHLNGNKTDNSFHNIVLGSHSENMLDIPDDIRKKNGLNASLHSRKYTTKYDDEEIKNIKCYYYSSKSYVKTMNKFNISNKSTLFYILKNR